jgi:hypothetical protein
MEAADLDAAVLAADERLVDLFSDLKSLVARSDAERKEAAESRRSEAGKMTASTDWDELLGSEKESDDDDEDAPEPRRTPIARPTSREPTRRVSFSPWTIDSLAAGETKTATRTTNRAKKVGGQKLTLRRAVEDILRADWGRVGTLTPGEDVLDMVRREKEATKELRREMNLLLDRRRVDALAARPPQNTISSDSRHSAWKPAADDVVFIDPSLLEGDGTGVRRSRAGKQSGVRAPWGGGGGRIRQGASPASGKLWPRGSTVTQSTPPWLPFGYRRPADPSVRLSRFEERCASAVRAHLETLTIKRRRELLDDWGAVGGRFDGAELSVQIELTAMHADNVNVGGVGGMVLTQGSTHFVPVQAQPLQRLKLCLGDPTTNVVVAGRSAHATLGWINVEYDENGMCDLPAFCGSVLYRRRVSGGETETASRYFVRFSFREHARIFARAVHLCGGTAHR